ncbi:hypothetical protein GOP47_0009287 [Adiantum capillus-veneris]|uniref:Uncharacterized protein n=1 Tax=Adiantum capillus-veneris TaxID=13818 RepID=A0A9D4UWF6_ADICA|nr:hypothetical protein GOP47_0009287 [Adiantum capillus-veneris]
MSKIDASDAIARARRLGKFYVQRETNEYKELVYSTLNRKIFYCKLVACQDLQLGIVGIVGRKRMVRHLSREHGLVVEIPDQCLAKKHTTSGDSMDIDSAKRALCSFNPSIPHNSKLAHVFITGYMECKKGKREEQPIDEVDLVTPPHAQRPEGGIPIAEDVLHEAADTNLPLEENNQLVDEGVDNSIDVEGGKDVIRHHVAAGPSKDKRHRRKVPKNDGGAPRRSTRLNACAI